MRLILSIAASVALVAPTIGCGSTGDSTTKPRGDCPTEPISVVVTVAPWSGIVTPLAGDCARVTTIVKSATTDPHDFEPTPGDAVEFERADVVVLNGLGYDRWAQKALTTLDSTPTLVDAGAVAGLSDGANPHLWYRPDDVHRMIDAVTDALKSALPSAAHYFDIRHAAWQQSMAPYDAEVAMLRGRAATRTYAATEPVFDPMAAALTMTDATPRGYRNAVSNESDPSPGDLAEFDGLLRAQAVDVLVVNTQTTGAASRQLRATARDSGVAVLEVTESPPPGATGFIDWQLSQLRALEKVFETRPGSPPR